MLLPSKHAKGSKKQATNGNNKPFTVYERSDLLDKHLNKPSTQFGEDDRIEAING